MPPDPQRSFFILNMLQNNYKEKLRLEIYQNLVPPPRKISEYSADMKTLFKGLFTPFLGITSLYLVNIQPNSKFHPPPKFSGSASACEIKGFFRTPPL